MKNFVRLNHRRGCGFSQSVFDEFGANAIGNGPTDHFSPETANTN